MQGIKLTVARWGPGAGIIVLLGLVWLLARLAGPAATAAFVNDWYAVLSRVYQSVGIPLNDLARGVNVPLVSALLLGVVGAFSPCQLSTGTAALAYLAPRTDAPQDFKAALGAFVAGKVLTYSLIGGAVVLAGFRANDSIPLIETVRKALGPLMIVLALQFLGVLRISIAPGQRLGAWIEDRVAGNGAGSAFALGVAFALAFCPTLFLLFFGLLLPLALTHPLGLLYPGLFAVGTVLPLSLLAVALKASRDAMRDGLRRAGGLDRGIRWTAAAALLLTGMNDTLVYWFV